MTEDKMPEEEMDLQQPEPTMEELEKATAPGGVDKAIDKLTDEIAEAMEPLLDKIVDQVLEVPPKESPINDKQELPKAGAPLSPAEQLAHTQTAYKCLLEDFTKVSQELAVVKKDVENCTRANFGVADILKVPEGESILLTATALMKQIADLQEGNRILKRRLQGTV